MLVTDIVLLALLMGFCAARLWRGLGHRDALLWTFAAGAVTTSVLAILDGRWQAAIGGIVATLFLLVLAGRHLRGARPRTGTPFISGAALLLLTGVAFLPLYWFPIFSLPEPQGPSSVGVRDFELTDHGRMGVLYAADDEPRRLAVRAWVPGGIRRRPGASTLRDGS